QRNSVLTVPFNCAALLLALIRCLTKPVTFSGLSKSSPNMLDAFGDDLAIPRAPTSCMEEFLRRFSLRVTERHNSASMCCAASERFGFQYQGEERVLGCLAVLHEVYDLGPLNHGQRETSHMPSSGLQVDFTIVPVTGTCKSPTQWLQAQYLGAYF